MSTDLYLNVARDAPSDVRLGGALITMVDPLPGREEIYNRWYEDDHFYAGATVGPWVFAGRRYVRAGALPLSGGQADATKQGAYIAVYWHLDGHVDDVQTWAIEALAHLIDEGRGSEDRVHVYTGFHRLAFAHVFDPAPMKPIHALDHPYPGLVFELIDAPAASARAALLDWLRDDLVPAQGDLGGQAIAFIPKPMDPERAATRGWKDVDPECRVCLLWFLRDPPADGWPGRFESHREAIVASGLGELILAAPFVPTLPGTSTDVTV